MRDILNNNDIASMNIIKNAIVDKDIRTHSQLKAELQKSGFKVEVKRDASGNVKSYSISENNANTNGKGQTFNWDSAKGKDREFMKQFDELINKNRQNAIEKKNEKEPKQKPKTDIEQLRQANKALQEGKGFEI